MPLLIASLTGPLVTFATHVINTLGLAGVLVMTATSGVIGVPGSEPTMLFAGFAVFQGHQTLVGIIIAGVLGDLLGATIAYSIGYWGRHELLERHGGKVHMSAERLERPSRWFERYGSPVIFVSRLLPGLRAVFPYAAGVSQMRFGRFFTFAALGSIIWITGLGVLGREVGRNWSSWRHHLEYGDYALAVILVLALLYLVFRRLRGSHQDPGAAGDAVSDLPRS